MNERKEVFGVHLKPLKLDSNVDVETAHNANLPCCGAVWGFRTREELNAAGAEYLAENSDELYDVIMK